MVVCHDDTAPLMEDGSYRNWLVDLSFGSHSQNMVDWHRTSADGTNAFGRFKAESADGNSAVAVPTPRILHPVEIIPEAPPIRTFENPLERLMDNPPQYVQYWKETKWGGSKYVLSEKSGLVDKEFKSVSRKSTSDKVKFLQILHRMGHPDYQGLIEYLNIDDMNVLTTILGK